jgi:hypothetical protein
LPSRPGKTTRLIKALPGNSDVLVPVELQKATMPQRQFARNSLPTVIARVFSKSVRNSPGGSKKRVQRSLISGWERLSFAQSRCCHSFGVTGAAGFELSSSVGVRKNLINWSRRTMRKLERQPKGER